jgi:hypothetical protein
MGVGGAGGGNIGNGGNGYQQGGYAKKNNMEEEKMSGGDGNANRSVRYLFSSKNILARTVTRQATWVMKRKMASRPKFPTQLRSKTQKRSKKSRLTCKS